MWDILLIPPLEKSCFSGFNKQPYAEIIKIPLSALRRNVHEQVGGKQ